MECDEPTGAAARRRQKAGRPTLDALEGPRLAVHQINDRQSNPPEPPTPPTTTNACGDDAACQGHPITAVRSATSSAVRYAGQIPERKCGIEQWAAVLWKLRHSRDEPNDREGSASDDRVSGHAGRGPLPAAHRSRTVAQLRRCQLRSSLHCHRSRSGRGPGSKQPDAIEEAC